MNSPVMQHSEEEQQRREREQWVRNRPSLFVDLALGLLFFVVSKATGNLTTAALVGAGAGVFCGVLRDIFCAEIPAAFRDHRPCAVCAFVGC